MEHENGEHTELSTKMLIKICLKEFKCWNVRIRCENNALGKYFDIDIMSSTFNLRYRISGDKECY